MTTTPSSRPTPSTPRFTEQLGTPSRARSTFLDAGFSEQGRLARDRAVVVRPKSDLIKHPLGAHARVALRRTARGESGWRFLQSVDGVSVRRVRPVVCRVHPRLVTELPSVPAIGSARPARPGPGVRGRHAQRVDRGPRRHGHRRRRVGDGCSTTQRQSSGVHYRQGDATTTDWWDGDAIRRGGVEHGADGHRRPRRCLGR